MPNDFRIKRSSTSQIIHVFLQDSRVVTSYPTGLTGLVYNTASLVCYYIREGEPAATSITLATATLGTWTSGGFKEVSSANMPGVYEFHIPNTVMRSGTDRVTIMFKGAANLATNPVLLRLDERTEADAYDAASQTETILRRFGLDQMADEFAKLSQNISMAIEAVGRK